MRIEDVILNAPYPIKIIHGKKTSCLEEIIAQTRLVKHALLSKGLKPHSPVVLFTENGIEFITGMLGILACGGLVVPVYAGLPFEALNKILKDTGATVLCFAGHRPKALLQNHGQELAIYKAISLEKIHVNDIQVEFSAPSGLSSDDSAFILYSSGATGASKGVVLSHRAIMENVDAILAYLGLGANDIFYIAKSMVHSSTITGEILAALRCGAGLIAMDLPVSANELFRRIEKYRPTIICIPPSLLYFFCMESERLKSLRTIHVSGAVINKNTFREIYEKFPGIRLINGYGLTEAGPRVAQSCTAKTFMLGAVGKPIAGVSLEVRRADGTQCSYNEVGEIYVRSSGMMKGYWLRGQIKKVNLLEGWLATGDMGFKDAEGDLIVKGRKDDLIITNSHNVTPQDVEEVIMQLREIKDCVVFGVDDKLLGQRLECGYSTTRISDIEVSALQHKIRKWCNLKLASYQIPKNFYQWTEVPCTVNGKKSRKLAKEQLMKTKEYA